MEEGGILVRRFDFPVSELLLMVVPPQAERVPQIIGV